ncbi:MAG: hypothetical protein SPH68_04170 [Candidatus Borkfalkiaceae bacterium]|nr:hypothetical protein [Clostridia bacterium]MDY6223335.1 hypothetical protein [Christensenellaceae bacterium]
MHPKDVAILVLSVTTAIFFVASLVLFLKMRKITRREKAQEERADKVKIVQGVRYSQDEAISDRDGMNVTHLQNDFILSRNKVYRAEKGGELMPGVYTALSANGNDRNFKLRVGGLVKNFVHGDEVVIGDGEEICAASATVILR